MHDRFLQTGPADAPVRFLCAHGAGAGMDRSRVVGLDLGIGIAIIDGVTTALPMPPPSPSLVADGGDLIYTTGTTGRAKGVVLPSKVQHATGLRYAQAQDLGWGKTIHSPIPIFTASAVMTLVLPVVTADATYSIDCPFDPAQTGTVR